MLIYAHSCLIAIFPGGTIHTDWDFICLISHFIAKTSAYRMYSKILWMNEINHYFYLKDLDAENTGGCSDFFLFYLLHTRGVWFWVGVRWNVWVWMSPNWFGSQPYPLTGKEANILSFEIHEGSLFIESEENDLADSPISTSLATWVL